MLIDEYRELVKLTSIHLLETTPKKPQAQAILAAAPLPKPIIANPKEPIKPLPLPPKVEPEVKTHYQEPSDILDLLKTHCPKLTLIDPPEEKKTAFILFDQDEEKGPLSNIVRAIQKEGYSADLLQTQAITESHIQNSLSLLIGTRAIFINSPLLKTNARKDASGKAFIAKASAIVITNLTDDAAKRTLWGEIKTRLKD